MPFIGRDWRSPGEAWVKTESLGWQRAKIIESSTIHPTACHLRSCNEYLDTSSCIGPKSWPPKTEIGKHMPKESSHHKSSQSKNIQRKLRQSWLKVVNDEKINSIDTHTVGIMTDGNTCCCCKNLEAPHTSNLLSKSVSPERHCSSVDYSMNYNNEQQRERSLTPSCPRSESANSSSSLLENYNNEQELLTSTPTIHYQTPSPDTSSVDDHETMNCKEYKQVKSSSSESNSPIDNNRTQRKSQHSTAQQINRGCCHHHNYPRSSSPQAAHQVTVKQAPHCQITLKPTREVATYNTISEAFYRLDFCNAIHDIRRFNYICKLLHLLITQNLTSLSGCATRILFTMLEQVAWQVASNKQNIHILYNLLDDLKKMIQKYYCWGRPIGSSLLWQQHFSTIERISHLADQIDITPPPSNDNSQKTMNDLPAEMIREIMLRLNDYRDLVNSAEASSVMQSILNGQHIWRQLCKYHFTKQQLRLAIENHYGLSQSTSWSSSNVKFAKFVSADGRSICRRPINPYERRKQIKQLSDCRDTSAQAFKSKKSITKSDNQSISMNSDSTDPTQDMAPKNSQRLDEVAENERCLSTEQSIFNDSDKVKNSSASAQSKENLDSSHDNHVYQKKLSFNRNEQDLSVNSVQNERNRLKDKTNLINDRGNSCATNKANCNNNSQKRQEELDWEQVFHQLRKKFGLKEEYADCLVLCRHCRCLFWKSFGHPCIKGELVTENGSACASSDCDLQKERPLEGENPTNEASKSVAVLSQSYLQRVNNQSVQNSGSDSNSKGTGNNITLRQQQSAHPGPSQQTNRHGSSSNSADNNAESSSMSRSMLQTARSNLVQQPRSLLQSDNSSNRPPNNANGDNNNGRPARNIQKSTYSSHVAISPQAFLKFFSL